MTDDAHRLIEAALAEGVADECRGAPDLIDAIEDIAPIFRDFFKLPNEIANDDVLQPVDLGQAGNGIGCLVGIDVDDEGARVVDVVPGAIEDVDGPALADAEDRRDIDEERVVALLAD